MKKKALSVILASAMVLSMTACGGGKAAETTAAATEAAADGSIDDIIDPAELRQRICSAVYMLMMKYSNSPERRHCNLPL